MTIVERIGRDYPNIIISMLFNVCNNSIYAVAFALKKASEYPWHLNSNDIRVKLSRSY